MSTPLSRRIFAFVGISIMNLGYAYSLFAASEFFSHAQTLANNGVIRVQSNEWGYRLSSTITRAESTKLALTSAGVAQRSCLNTSSFSFSDVSSSIGDLCGYIEGAVDNGIISPSTRFYPNVAITRGDFASIIVKAFDVGSPNLIGNPSEGTMYYTDVSSSVVNATSINRLATTGCINTTLTSFRPYANISRGEAFKMMACLIGKKNGANTGNNGGTINTNPIGTDCYSLYWKDSTNMSCQSQKQFCGTYMYQGLQTFSTQQACLGNINTSNQTTTTPPSTSYVWSTTSYGTCSKTCGGGVQTRTISCKKTTDNTTVDDSYCVATGVAKPVSQKLCNVTACGGANTTSPTASLTVNGQENITIKVGDTYARAWTSANANSWASTFRFSGTSCGKNGVSGTWQANTANGANTSTAYGPEFANCTATITYTATDTTTGLSATDTVVITISPSSTSSANWPFSEPDSGYGLWIPPGTQKLYVADAAYLFGMGSPSYVNVPGCLNTRPSPAYDKCRSTRKYVDGKGVEIKYLKDDIIAIRVTGVAYDGTDVLRRSGGDGGNYVGGEDISISEIPGDFNVATGCIVKNTGFNGSQGIWMSNGSSYTKSSVACNGNGCQSMIGTTYKNQTLSNGASIQYIGTSTGVTSLTTTPTCKIVPGKKYYVNLKNVSTHPEYLYNSLLLGFNVFYWSHLDKPTGGSYAGRWKYYSTSSGAVSEYGAHYIPWTTLFYGQGTNGNITTRYKRYPLAQNDGDECTGVYHSSSNTWFEGMYSGAKLVCEPGTPSQYVYSTAQSMGTQDVILNDYSGFQGYAGGDTVQVKGYKSTTTQARTLQGSGKPMTITDVQASIVNDFGSSCSAIANMQAAPYKEWTLSPRNPRNCEEVSPGITSCTFTSEVVRSYCNLGTRAPANTAQDVQAAQSLNPLPYPFFVGNTDPVTGN